MFPKTWKRFFICIIELISHNVIEKKKNENKLLNIKECFFVKKSKEKERKMKEELFERKVDTNYFFIIGSIQ